MERTTFSIYFLVRESKARKNGNAPIGVTISINGERARFITGKQIPVSKWDKIKQQVKGKDAEATSINSYLKAIKVKLYEKEIELLNRGFVVTAELLKDAYLDRVDSIKEKTLLEVFKEHNEAQESMLGKGVAKATYWVSLYTLKLLPSSDWRSADAAGFCKAGIQKIGDRDARKGLVSPEHDLSLSKQCAILGLNRTSIYYTPKGESKENLEMMQKIDAEHLDHPAKGVVGMTDFLLEEGYKVGLRKVRRMMRLMGIMPVCHRKHLSKLGSASYIKPYPLRGLDIDHRNQVWCIDITYIPMKKGFMYLTAIIDVFSRFIVGWSLHNSLDASHCIEVLQNAIATYGAPEIINSDQDCQFTCKAWLDACAQHPQMRVSMDGRGRAKDNIWIERLWEIIKYEYIYTQPEENGTALYSGIKRFIDNYNYHRRHQGIDCQVPSKLYIRPAA